MLSGIVWVNSLGIKLGTSQCLSLHKRCFSSGISIISGEGIGRVNPITSDKFQETLYIEAWCKKASRKNYWEQYILFYAQ